MTRTDPCIQPAEGRETRRCLFEREVTRLMDRLYGTALRLARNPDDAEDLVADAVGQAWARLDQLRDPDQIEGWLFRILNRRFIDAVRRRRCRQDLETELAPEETNTAGDLEFSLYARLHQPFLLWWSTPEQEFVNGLLQEDIQAALDALPDVFRVAIVLVEVQGYTYAEAAELLEVPVGTVRSRLNRARALLQRTLWQHGRDAGLTTAPQHHPDSGGGEP